MRSHPSILPCWSLLFLAACGANHKDPPAEPSGTEASPHAGHSALPSLPGDGEAPAAEAAVGCAPSGTVIYTQTSTPLRAADGGPAWTFLLHDSGYWSADGIGEAQDATGCLSAEGLASFQTQLSAVELAAIPLGPDEMRCMAMPIAELAVEAGGKRAAWKNPCGPERPSASLAALMDALAVDTHQKDRQP